MPDAPTLGPEEIDEATAVALALLPAGLGHLDDGQPVVQPVACRTHHHGVGAPAAAVARSRRDRPIRRLTPLLLAVATGAGFLAGLPGLIAAGFAGPLFFAYVLLGLAVVHFVTRGRPWRPFALWALYASLFVMNTVASLAIALLGLAEAIWPMRKISPPPQRSAADLIAGSAHTYSTRIEKEISKCRSFCFSASAASARWATSST